MQRQDGRSGRQENGLGLQKPTYELLTIILSYNWVLLENEVDILKSNSQLIY